MSSPLTNPVIGPPVYNDDACYDAIPVNQFQAYQFLDRARSHWLIRVRETSDASSSAFDTLRILQGAMTSVMIGARRSIY